MSLFDMISFAPRGRIGTIDIAATLEEIHIDTLRVTEHPVELGAAITDHAYAKPQEVIIKCGWSNSTLSELMAMASALFSGNMSASDYVSSVYAQLLAIQASRQPIQITTSKRQYLDMLIVGLTVTTDASTSAVLMVQAHCRQIIIVKTKATALPAKENQATPSKTAGIIDKGVSMLKSALPSKVGSIASKVTEISSISGAVSSAKSVIGGIV